MRNKKTIYFGILEHWKEHPKYDGLFVSDKGNFKRADCKPVKIREERQNGYLRISYKGRRIRCHVLVAETWLDPPAEPGQYVVHHIDGDKLNNRADNLEWRTPQENTAEAGKEGKLATTHGVPTPVIAVCVLTGKMMAFVSQQAAAEYFGVHNSSINKALRGGRKTCAGHWFYYLAEAERIVA